jgi:hypothetical protein
LPLHFLFLCFKRNGSQDTQRPVIKNKFQM